MGGRSIELVFGDGQDEQGGSGSGVRVVRGVHAAAMFRMWPRQQAMAHEGAARRPGGRKAHQERWEEGGGGDSGVHHEQRLTGGVHQWG